jgi:hypothetical protein
MTKIRQTLQGFFPGNISLKHIPGATRIEAKKKKPATIFARRWRLRAALQQQLEKKGGSYRREPPRESPETCNKLHSRPFLMPYTHRGRENSQGPREEQHL